MSPIIDSYSALNEPHAHPSGLMSLLNNSHLQSGIAFPPTNASSGMIRDNSNNGSSNGDFFNLQSTQKIARKNNLAGVMKLDRVFPININYLNSNNKLETFDLTKNQHTSINLMPAAGNVSAHLMMTHAGSDYSVINDSVAGTNATFPTNTKKQGKLTSIPGYYEGAHKQKIHRNSILNQKNPNIFASGQQSIQ